MYLKVLQLKRRLFNRCVLTQKFWKRNFSTPTMKPDKKISGEMVMYFGVNGGAKSNAPMVTNITSYSKHNFVVDEPPELMGTNTGANPMEFLCGTLISCNQIMIDIIKNEKFKKDPISKIEWECVLGIDANGLLGVKDAIVAPQGIKAIAKVYINDKNEKENILNMKNEVEQRCPVYNLYKNAGMNVETEWLVVNI